jgi:hypothetical protein
MLSGQEYVDEYASKVKKIQAEEQRPIPEAEKQAAEAHRTS